MNPFNCIIPSDDKFKRVMLAKQIFYQKFIALAYMPYLESMHSDLPKRYQLVRLHLDQIALTPPPDGFMYMQAPVSTDPSIYEQAGKLPPWFSDNWQYKLPIHTWSAHWTQPLGMSNIKLTLFLVPTEDMDRLPIRRIRSEKLSQVISQLHNLLNGVDALDVVAAHGSEFSGRGIYTTDVTPPSGMSVNDLIAFHTFTARKLS